MRKDTLSLDEARRITLAAQGFATPRPRGRVTRRHLRALFARLGMVQLDSVNVLVRSHYLPLFARLGPYDRTLLDRFAYEDHEVFEYWGHEASLIRSDLEPLLRWRMARDHRWPGMRRFIEGHDPKVLDALAARVLADGPVSAGDLDGKDRRAEPWWGWGDTKRGLEHLFSVGRVGAVRRANTFERAYCDPAHVVPESIRARPTPDLHDAFGRLARAGGAHLRRRDREGPLRLLPPRHQGSAADRRGDGGCGRAAPRVGRGVAGAGVPPSRGDPAPCGRRVRRSCPRSTP